MCKHECSGATNAYGECLRRYERLRKMKKPPAVSGAVPTYGRRLFTSIYTRRVILMPNKFANAKV